MPRRDESAPYHVQLRDAERHVLYYAITNNEGDLELAAAGLGITKRYMLARAKQLGGVFPDQPRLEPPPSIWPVKAQAKARRKPRRRSS